MSNITDFDDWNTNWASQARIASRNPAQRFRHRIIASIVKDLRPNRCLDIGCGSGDLLARLADGDQRLTLFGLEGSRIGTELSQKKVPSAHIWNLDLSTDTQSWSSGVRGIEVDCAILSEVLEHVDDVSGLLEKCSHFLMRDGSLIVTVPGGPRTAFDKAIGHRRHYTRSELKKLLREAGFCGIYVTAPGFPFFNIYKLTVLLRGKKLVSDIAHFNNGSGRLAIATMWLFDVLFRVTPRSGRWGWQLIAVAKRK